MVVREPEPRSAGKRRQMITATARALAEREGWDAVTTRRLSAEIEYSQPVIYKHFASMDDLLEAVALQGFDELAEALRQARGAAAPHEAVGAIAWAYSSFAAANPALYDAMFTRATQLRFGPQHPEGPLSRAYGELRTAVQGVAGERDVDDLSEVLWAALHDLTALSRDGRLRPAEEGRRMDLLIEQFQAPA